MDTMIRAEDIIAGEKIAVGVGEIEQELTAVWQAIAHAPTEEEQVAITLVRVLNLVTYAEGQQRGDEAHDVISLIAGRHPCRSLLLIRSGERSAPAGISASISAHCNLANESGKQICSEQITIAAQGEAIANMPVLALNLAIADIPVFLWWTASAPFEAGILSGLSESTDRLIMDSARFRDPVPGLIKMAALAGRLGPRRQAVSDFNWTRLTLWREATAQFFDLAQTRRYLYGISTVEITYAAPDGGAAANPVQALLCAGWLASRLNWKFESAAPDPSNTQYDLRLRRDGQPITIRIRPVDAPCQTEGALVSVRLETVRPGPGIFAFACHPEEQYATTSVSLDGAEPTERRMIYLEPDEANLLNQELEMFDRDLIYEEALELAVIFARGSAPAQRRSIVA